MQYYTYDENNIHNGSFEDEDNKTSDFVVGHARVTAIEPPAVSQSQYAQFDGTDWVVIEGQDREAARLELIKDIKQQRLSYSAGEAITAGANSNALGSTHLYPTDPNSQSNLQALVIAGIDSEFMCRDSNGLWLRRMHTAVQLQQLLADGMAHIKTLLDELDTRRAALAAATTQTEIDAVSEDF